MANPSTLRNSTCLRRISTSRLSPSLLIFLICPLSSMYSRAAFQLCSCRIPPAQIQSENQSINSTQRSPIPNIPRRAFLRSLILPLLAQVPVHAESGSVQPQNAPYDIHAKTYDILDAPNSLSNLLGLTQLRSTLISKARGKTLELALGTGVNLPFYKYPPVTQLTGLDLSSAMLSVAKTRIETLQNAPPIHLLQSSAEDTHLPAAEFDTVLQTFSLCVFQNPLTALAEMKRLVAPAGSVLLLEHTLSPARSVAAYQNLTAQPAASLSKGCVANRDVVAMVKDVGFRINVCEYHLAGTVVYLELSV